MNKKQFVIFSIIGIIIFIVSILFDYFKSNENQEKIKSYNLNLSGIIIKKQNFTYGHSYGYVTIDIKNSNYDYFDSRGKEDDYFFIIKEKKCLLLLSGMGEVLIGDSIVVKSDKYDVYRDRKEYLKNGNLVLLPSKYRNSSDKF